MAGDAGSSPRGRSDSDVTPGAAPHGGQRAGVCSQPPGPHGPWLRAASVMSGFPGTSDSPCVQTKQILDGCGWRPVDTVELADGGTGTQDDLLR